jgi:hypothetical protein
MMMKIILIYILLGLLSLSMISTVDLIAGMNFAIQMQTIHAVFSTTTTQEHILMAVFLALPIINVITASLNKRKKPSQ